MYSGTMVHSCIKEQILGSIGVGGLKGYYGLLLSFSILY